MACLITGASGCATEPKIRSEAKVTLVANAAEGTRGPAVDGRWQEFRGYLQEVIDRVNGEWEKILMANTSFPPFGTRADVTFTLNRRGEVTRINFVDGDCGDLGQRAGASAITRSAPYGVWTDDMVKVLGEEQQMTFTFYYR